MRRLKAQNACTYLRIFHRTNMTFGRKCAGRAKCELNFFNLLSVNVKIFKNYGRKFIASENSLNEPNEQNFEVNKYGK